MDDIQEMGKIIGVRRSFLHEEFLSCVPVEYINRDGSGGHIINPMKVYDSYTDEEVVEMYLDNSTYIKDLGKLANIQESYGAFGILLLNSWLFLWLLMKDS